MESYRDLVIDWKDKKPITTTVPRVVYDYIKEKGKTFNNLIMLGLMAEEGNPQLLDRVRDLENKVSSINRQFDELLTQIKILVADKVLDREIIKG